MRIRVAIATLAALAAAAYAQEKKAAAPPPGGFKIQAGSPAAQRPRFSAAGRKFAAADASVRDLIVFAYSVHRSQVGGPAWIESERYTVTAESDGDGRPGDSHWKAAIRGLLADRFRLVVRRETKPIPAYAITVAKDGHRLARSDAGPNVPPSLTFPQLGTLPGRNATIGELALVMQGAVLDRPVIDRTGLAGRWDFALRWTPDAAQFGGAGVAIQSPAGNPNAPADLFTAFERQLGLKLDPVTAPLEFLTVERVQRPSLD